MAGAGIGALTLLVNNGAVDAAGRAVPSAEWRPRPQNTLAVVDKRQRRGRAPPVSPHSYVQ